MQSTGQVTATTAALAEKSTVQQNIETQHIEKSPVAVGSIWHHRKGFAIACLACLATTQYGMDYGLIGGLQAMPGFLKVFGYKDPTSSIGWGIDSTVQQLINSLMTVGAFAACLCIGPLGKFIGRPAALFLGCIFNHVGAILMMASTKFAALYASRVVIGLANGLFMVQTQLYIQETSVPQIRGALLGMYQVCVAFGSILGSIVDNYTAPRPDRSAYLIPCGCLFIIPTFLMFTLLFMPESPRWLVDHDRYDEARKSLVRLRPSDTADRMIDAELNEMIEAVRIERSLAKGIRLVDMFHGTNKRRSILSICLVLSLSATGNLFFIVYGTYFFAIAGENKPFEETVGMNCAGLAGVLISLYLITKIGRRVLLLSGAAGQGICMLVIGATYSSGNNSLAANRCLVAFVILHIFLYTMCTAPYLYLVAGEIPSNRLRSFTLGIANAVGYFGAWLISFTVPYFINPQDLNWGPKYSWIWFGSNFAYFIFIFFFMPETKDRTLEEIDEMFEKRVPAWKFKSYVCLEVNEARAAGPVAVQQAEEKPRIYPDKYAGQVVMITGAAQGIGEVTSKLFARQGATVVMVDLQEDKLKQVAVEIEAGQYDAKAEGPPAGKGKAEIRACNVADEASVDLMVDDVIRTHGKIDVLIQLAAVYPFIPIVGHSSDDFKRVMDVNVTACFYLTKAVLPHMQKTGYGRLINTSSGTLQLPDPGLLAYVTSKSAIVGFTRSIAIEAGSGVTANVILPGLIRTPAVWKLHGRKDGSHPLFDRLLQKQCVKRHGRPDDIAHTINFIASPEAQFITGQIFDCGGGATFH
ncbi:hypothetical protein CLAIMM_09866 [Cladophialophora immunda]|nr:hypothetical protein CLAIMM_09866 [Cladophialophora immunda]